MNSQLEFADMVMKLFEGINKVKEVTLRGSLSNGVYDKYSDIDICVDVSGYNNADFTQTAISVMRSNLNIYFRDWATALLPDNYVISFYLKGVPIFWQVDIHCSATPHYPTITRDCVNNDPLAHLIKLWVIHAKYVLRGKIHENLPILLRRVLGKDYEKHTPPARLLQFALDKIIKLSDGRFPELFNQCREISSIQLADFLALR